MPDQNGIWPLEFWNRSLKRVWSLDGTAPGPGPTLTPDLAQADGALYDRYAGVDYVVADAASTRRGSRSTGGRPARLPHERAAPAASLATGVYPDGWTGQQAGLLALLDRPAAGAGLRDGRA